MAAYTNRNAATTGYRKDTVSKSMAAGAGPAVVLAGRPATQWTSGPWAGRVEAFLLVNLATQNNGLVRQEAHMPGYYDVLLMLAE